MFLPRFHSPTPTPSLTHIYPLSPDRVQAPGGMGGRKELPTRTPDAHLQVHSGHRAGKCDLQIIPSTPLSHLSCELGAKQRSLWGPPCPSHSLTEPGLGRRQKLSLVTCRETRWQCLPSAHKALGLLPGTARNNFSWERIKSTKIHNPISSMKNQNPEGASELAQEIQLSSQDLILNTLTTMSLGNSYCSPTERPFLPRLVPSTQESLQGEFSHPSSPLPCQTSSRAACGEHGEEKEKGNTVMPSACLDQDKLPLFLPKGQNGSC